MSDRERMERAWAERLERNPELARDVKRYDNPANMPDAGPLQIGVSWPRPTEITATLPGGSYYSFERQQEDRHGGLAFCAIVPVPANVCRVMVDWLTRATGKWWSWGRLDEETWLTYRPPGHPRFPRM